MEAIILHNNAGVRIREIQKKLKNENIKTRNKKWTPEKPINAEILDTNMLIIYLAENDYDFQKIIAGFRRQRYSMPIAVVDEQFSEQNRKTCLAFGADVYVARETVGRKLATDLKFLVCKKESANGMRWLKTFSLRLDLENRFAKRKQTIIPLRNKEFSLLEFFMINRGKILTRNMILEHVWDRNANFASNTVDVHINRLRKKIDDPFKEKLIHTVHCIGYCFDKKKRPL